MIRPRADLRLILLLAVVALFYSAFTQRAPYHADTASYVESAKEFLATGAFSRSFDRRLLNVYAYVPFVWAMGASGIKALSIVAVLGFCVFYYLTLRREFDTGVAVGASLLLLSVPASVITVTHLKEDFFALLFLTAALWMLGPAPSLRRCAGAGAAFGLACLSKEYPLILLPFMLGQVALRRTPVDGLRDLLRITWLRGAAPAWGAFVVVAAATILLISPRHLAYLYAATASPHTGQFLGVGSAVQPIGFQFWREGMLYLAGVHLVLLPLVVGALWRGQLTRLLWFFGALSTFLFFSNLSVVRGRLFAATAFFTAPLIADALSRALAWVIHRRHAAQAPVEKPSRARPGQGRAPLPLREAPSGAPVALHAGALYAIITAFALLQVSYVLPTLTYRLAYPPQAEFYGGVRDSLPSNRLLLGMDNCVLARYYGDCPCLARSLDPGAAGSQAFLAALSESLAVRPVYVLPDFFSYDSGGVLRREFQKTFRLERAYMKLGEDYHDMTYGLRMSEVVRKIEAGPADCIFENATKTPVFVNPSLSLEAAAYDFRCRGGEQTKFFLEYRGVQTFLAPQVIYRVRP